MEEENRFESVIREQVSKISKLVDVDTVIGKPIVTPNGAHIIPFTKVVMGTLSGGGEYGEAKLVNEDKTKAEGGGVFLSVKPEGFLIEDEKGCRLFSVTDDPASKLIEKAIELIGNMAKK